MPRIVIESDKGGYLVRCDNWGGEDCEVFVRCPAVGVYIAEGDRPGDVSRQEWELLREQAVNIVRGLEGAE
jgi:hypothetical protein